MKRAFTLLELLMSAAIFTVLFSAALSTLTIQNNNWRRTQDKLSVQQEARKGMDRMSGFIKQSNPNWVVGGEDHLVTISTVSSPNDRIDFYRPEFVDDGTGNVITMLKAVAFGLNPANPTELLLRNGAAAPVVVANNVAAISFNCGCTGCTVVNQACPIVEIAIQTSEPNPHYQPAPVFNLTSRVTLRNSEAVALDEGTLVEEPEEGAF